MMKCFLRYGGLFFAILAAANIVYGLFYHDWDDLFSFWGAFVSNVLTICIGTLTYTALWIIRRRQQTNAKR